MKSLFALSLLLASLVSAADESAAVAKARAANSPVQRQAVLAEFANATDDATRSALIAAAREHATDFLLTVLVAPNAPALTAFATSLLPGVTPDRATQLVQACANAPLAANPIKAVILRGLSQMPGVPPFVDVPTTRLLQRLLQNPDTVAATLPLVARWDRTGALTNSAEPAIRQMLRDLVDRAQTDARRLDLATSLLALLKSRPDALRTIGELLADPIASPTLKSSLLTALGDAPGADTTELLIATLAQSKSPVAFEQLLRRPESSRVLLAAVDAGKISVADLGADNVARLRASASNSPTAKTPTALPR